MFRLRRLAFPALACLTLLGSGCLPGVAWLPDSSGFIYIDGGNNRPTRVIHFNLATKQSRVLIEKAEESVQPGLSPDGKRIAVAKHTQPRDQPHTVQVVIYDDGGKELARSKEFVWKQPSPKGGDIRMPPALYWSPHGDRIVVFCDNTTGLYDVKAQTLQVIAETMIVNIAGTPILPDKSGFLAVHGKVQGAKGEKSAAYALIDWQGKVRELKTPADLFPYGKKGPLENEELLFMTMFLAPPMHSSRWDKGVAEITFSGNTLTIDTGKLEVSLKKADLVEIGSKKIPAVKLGPGRFLHSRYPLGPGVEVRTVLLEKKKDDKTIRLLPQQQVELLLPGQKEPKLLVADAELVVATPSPNGEWLALRCAPHQGGKERLPERLLVINRKGEVIEAGVPAK
jgi:hypothetical protein